MNKDPLYFHRSALAETLLSAFQSGISSAFTLFAPRRMGKTQFLLQDITPLAKEKGFAVFYFSFMDRHDFPPAQLFQRDLFQFKEMGTVKRFLDKVNKVEVFGLSMEREQSALPNVRAIMDELAERKEPTLLLLDEVQELARLKNTDDLIRSLRTGLDIHQQKIKTIFTGSSTNGLRLLFQDLKAPFFQFSHSINFPTLGREFTDFMANIYQERTGQILDKEVLFDAFERLYKIPMHFRSLIADLILNPDLSLSDALFHRLNEIDDQNEYALNWVKLSAIERLILQMLANGQEGLYSENNRQQMAEALGIEHLKTSTIQSAIRRLQNKDFITRNLANKIQLNNTLFANWIKEQS